MYTAEVLSFREGGATMESIDLKSNSNMVFMYLICHGG
jgi:hypothetical protein